MNKEKFVKTTESIKDKMYFLALRLLRSKDEAKDVVQDVFLKLWERKKDMPLYKNTECYVIKMVRNICLDRLKNKHSGLETYYK